MNTAVSRRLFWAVTVLSLSLIVILALVLANVVRQQKQVQRSVPVVEKIELGRVADPIAPSVGTATDAETLSSLFQQAVGRVRDAVVYIQVDVGGGSDPGWEERFFQPSPRQSVGSGVIIGKDGYIITNSHVVERASRILVTLADKRQFAANVVGTDASTDLAVLKIEGAEELPVAMLGNSDEVEVGQWVLAIGNPFRLTSTVTAGIVSALGRQVNIIGDSFGIEDFIQTDAAINPGNSGGALVDLNGALVGINTAIATESGSYEGYGFAVPVNLASRIATDLIAYGEVQRAFLGVEIRRVDARLAERIGLENIGGVYLHDVWRGAAADRAGLRIGDVVVTVGGQAVNAPNELQSLIARQRPGDSVELDVWRRGTVRRFAVVLMGREDPAAKTWFADRSAEDQRPEEVPPEHLIPDVDVTHLEDLGIGVRLPSERDLSRFGADSGVYVAYVEKGGAAAGAGLMRDVLIQSVDARTAESIVDLQRYLTLARNDQRSALLEVVRRDGTAAFYEIDF